jgi:FkbM family methyltransferase
MFFDIGSNVGLWSIANIHNTSKIISIEASPTTFENLLKNTRDNKNIENLNYVVSNNNCEDITFYEAEANTLSTINKEWLTSPESRFYNMRYNAIKCKSITLDKLIEIYGIPELIKIDVEGGEYDCISSLTTKTKYLCFEWASETNSITINCLDYLQKIGFTRFYIQYKDDYTFRPQEHLYTTNINNIKEDLIKTTPKDHWGMIWCM